jgi:hypothetical protein
MSKKILFVKNFEKIESKIFYKFKFAVHILKRFDSDLLYLILFIQRKIKYKKYDKRNI